MKAENIYPSFRRITMDHLRIVGYHNQDVRISVQFFPSVFLSFPGPPGFRGEGGNRAEDKFNFVIFYSAHCIAGNIKIPLPISASHFGGTWEADISQ